jgi:hypothetical protein
LSIKLDYSLMMPALRLLQPPPGCNYGRVGRPPARQNGGSDRPGPRQAGKLGQSGSIFGLVRGL